MRLNLDKKLIILAGLVLALAAAAGDLSAATEANRKVTCEDGRVIARTPFNAMQTAEQLCGEESITLPAPPADYVALFGPAPDLTAATDEESRKEIIRLRTEWVANLQNFGGVVTPAIVENIVAASNADALVDALAAGEFPASFTAENVAAVEKVYREYEAGVPVFFLTYVGNRTGSIKGDPDPGYRLLVKFQGLGLPEGVTRITTPTAVLNYPGFTVTYTQIKKIQNGIPVTPEKLSPITPPSITRLNSDLIEAKEKAEGKKGEE